MENPFKIIEAGVEYSLGKFDGQSVKYDFPNILVYLGVKGKLPFGERFKIYKRDKEILLKLFSYFIRNHINCKKFGMEPNKDLLLTGPVDCGKTSLMKLLPYLVPHQRKYVIMPCRNIVLAFNHLGHKTLENYGESGVFCFDDIGVEPMGRHYGKDCNVIGEILLSRYELFLYTPLKTHSDELEERYGAGVRSRMRELFNLIAFEQSTPDKRK